MKTTLLAILVLFSFSARASLCQSKPRLLWDTDKIVSQYECRNEISTLCATKAIYGLHDAEYVVLSGQIGGHRGHATLYALVWTDGEGEGKYYENNSVIDFLAKPAPTIILDSHKFRYEFVLNKKTGEASYREEAKEVLSFSRWKTLVDQEFRCQKLQ